MFHVIPMFSYALYRTMFHERENAVCIYFLWMGGSSMCMYFGGGIQYVHVLWGGIQDLCVLSEGHSMYLYLWWIQYVFVLNPSPHGPFYLLHLTAKGYIWP